MQIQIDPSKFRNVRRKAGLTQTELGEKLGESKQPIQALEAFYKHEKPIREGGDPRKYEVSEIKSISSEKLHRYANAMAVHPLNLTFDLPDHFDAYGTSLETGEQLFSLASSHKIRKLTPLDLSSNEEVRDITLEVAEKCDELQKFSTASSPSNLADPIRNLMDIVHQFEKITSSDLGDNATRFKLLQKPYLDIQGSPNDPELFFWEMDLELIISTVGNQKGLDAYHVNYDVLPLVHSQELQETSRFCPSASQREYLFRTLYKKLENTLLPSQSVYHIWDRDLLPYHVQLTGFGR